MKKTFAAFVAVATIAASLAATPASAQRGVAAGVAAGLIGGAIVVAHRLQPPGLGGPVYVEEAPRPAAWFASAIGTVTAGVSAASSIATDLTDRREFFAF